MTTENIVILAITIVIIVYFISIYNDLIGKRNLFKNAFSQIDIQLKRRYDLIPNLVETAKKFMEHEKNTLESVIKARNNCLQASQHAAKDPTNTESVVKLSQMEATLSGSLGKLFALNENYPELKSDQTMIQLQEELVSTENKLSFARQFYNDCVMDYNTYREIFPNSFISGFFKFKNAILWEIKDSAERQNIKIKF